MTIRVGESWQARNGHRRWVSMPLHDLLLAGLLGWGAWAILILPFLLLWRALLAEAWIAVEALLLVLTGVLAVVAMVWGDAKPGDVKMSRLRFGLWMVDVKGGMR